MQNSLGKQHSIDMMYGKMVDKRPLLKMQLLLFGTPEMWGRAQL